MYLENLLTNEPRRKVYEAVLTTKAPFTINQMVNSLQDPHINYHLVRNVLQGLTRRGFLIENTVRNVGMKTSGRPKATFVMASVAKLEKDSA